MTKILIADCESEINKSLKGFFEQLGYNAYAAKDINNLEGIVKEAKQYKPDVVLIDVRINKLLRLEAIDQIKKLGSNIKIMVMSTYGSKCEQKILHEIMAHGADEYLEKPFALEKLIDMVNVKTN